MSNSNELVANNMGLVYAVAKKFTNRGTDYEDLVQIGSIGLIKASKKFNKDLGYKFSTYAVNLIMGEIKRFLRDDGIIKISRKIKENMTKIRIATEKLKQISDREPTIKELSDYIKISEEDIVEALNCEPISNIEEENYNSIIDKSSIFKEDKLYIDDLLDKLDKKSKEVIIMRYYYDYTQKQIADYFHVSQVTVSRIEKAAINKMKYYS